MHKAILATLLKHACAAFSFTLCATLCVLWMDVCAFAQVDTGSIVGTVRDPSGAVAADSTVVVTNVDTHAVRTVQTNSEGEYAALLLQVGTYSISIEKPGFERSVKPESKSTCNRDYRSISPCS